MATIKDGVKIGLGLLLLKWLFGLGSCAVALGVVTCLMMNSDSPKKGQSAQTSASTATTSSGNTVQFKSGCNVRDQPAASGEKVGLAPAGQSFEVLDKQGRWHKVRLASGVEGWAGCRIHR